MTDAKKVALSCRRVCEVRDEVSNVVDLWLKEPGVFPKAVLDEGIATLVQINLLHQSLLLRLDSIRRAEEGPRLVTESD